MKFFHKLFGSKKSRAEKLPPADYAVWHSFMVDPSKWHFDFIKMGEGDRIEHLRATNREKGVMVLTNLATGVSRSGAYFFSADFSDLWMKVALPEARRREDEIAAVNAQNDSDRIVRMIERL